MEIISQLFRVLPQQLRNRMLMFILLFTVSINGTLTGQNRFPVLVAINPETGFLIDSSEAAVYGFFPDFSREGLNYIVLNLESSNVYNVTAFYKAGNRSGQRYEASQVKVEHDKYKVADIESPSVKDYTEVLNLFPEVSGYYYLNGESELIQYDPDLKIRTAKQNPVIFGNAGTGLYSIADDKFGFALQGMINMRIGRIVSTIEILGARNDFFLPDGAKDDYRFRDLNLRAGYLFLDKHAQMMISTGISFVRNKSIIESVPTGRPELVSTDDGIGIPFVYTLTAPARGHAGFYLTFKYNLVFSGDNAFGVTGGLRIGRTSVKGFK